MRMVINLTDEEREALKRMALSEMRQPREQVRFVLRGALTRQGYLEEPEAITCGSTIKINHTNMDAEKAGMRAGTRRKSR